MPKKVLSSWTSTADGQLIEQDMKVTYNEDDGSYELEVTKDSLGVTLGVDPDVEMYTILSRISEPARFEKFRHLVSVGDVLIAINDRVVAEEGVQVIGNIISTLIECGHPRKLRFINRKRCAVDLYMRKLQLSHKITDLLGFVISMEEYLEEDKVRHAQFAVMQQRDLEWVQYLKNIGGPENLKPAGVYKASKTLRDLVRRGIPVAYRPLIWQKISLSSINRLQYPNDYYQSLLNRIEELPSGVKDDIEKDVDRTFPDHQYFRHSGQGISALRRVLQAFALHNAEVGYCQSLNFVAGMMLIFMNEEDAFWLLVTVVETILPDDYYTKSMVGTYVDQFVLAHIIKKFLPNIHNALDKNQLQLPLITVQWFMCIFVNTLKPEITLRIWDMFLNEGCKVLFRISAALFKLHEQKLLLVKDASELFTVLRSIGKDVVDAEVLIATAYKSYKPNKMVRKTSSGNMLSKLVPSPRNMMYSPNRTASKGMMNVPADLQGLGVAHMGPLKLQPVPISNTSPIAPSTPKESALSPTEASDQSQLSPIELPSEVEESASVSSGVTKEDEDIEVDSTIRESTVVFAGTDLKSNIGELTGRNSFVENHSSLLVNKLKLEKRHKRGIKKGEFAFYRSDIALWRSSFRPGLEERHSKMEAARQKWRNKQITKENIAAGVVANTQDENVSGRKVVRKLGPVEISSPSALKLVKSVSMDSEISDISPDRFLGALPDSLDEDDEEDAADGRSLKTGMGSLSLSGSSSPYTPHSAGLTPTKRPSLDHRRASKSDLSSLLTNVPEDASGNDIDDVFDTTYSIDHTFDLDPTISANRTLLPHPLPPSPTAIVAPSPPVELST